MKKIMTAAAFLAAGIACMNAETYTWTNATVDGLWKTAGNWKTSAGEAATTLPTYTNTNDDTYIIGNGATISAMDHSVGNLGADLEIGDNVTITSNWAFIFKNATIGENVSITGGDGLKWAIKSTDTSSEENNLSLNSVYTCNATNAILRTIGVGSSIDFGTDGQIIAEKDCGTGKKLVLSATVSVGSGNNLELNNRVLISGYNIWYRDAQGDTGLLNMDALTVACVTGEEMTKYDFVTDLKAEWTIGGEATDERLGAYRYYATEADGIGIQYWSAIPEPSAFGLLAGLGALALVASRRRRK